jgi:hypothetical protein
MQSFLRSHLTKFKNFGCDFSNMLVIKKGTNGNTLNQKGGMMRLFFSVFSPLTAVQ